MQNATDTQGLIWNFICAYKKYSAQKISYIAVADDPDLLKAHLERARQSGSPELRALAEQVEYALHVNPMPAKRRPASPVPKQDVAVADHTRQLQAERGDDAYRALLHDIYGQGEPTVVERQSLDLLRRSSRIQAQRAHELENEIRAERALLPVDWDRELRESVRVLQRDGRLSERDRLQLFETYLSKGRLSTVQAEQILSEVLPPERPAQPPRRALWPVAAAALVAGIAVALVSVGPLSRLVGLTEAIADVPPPTPVVTVKDAIRTPTTWTPDKIYRLDGVIFVEQGASLTIKPGARIIGGFGSALVVTREAMLYARGTALEPIVFGSAKPIGERRPGDWGGLVLLGSAPVNEREAQIEGIDAKDARGRFGGDDPTDSCGVLEYVRVEFAGHEALANNELNGITLGGCGNGTIVRNVQVHRALDDGIEVFGGTVDLNKILITGAQDDSLDWDMGWTGRVQFLLVQQHADGGDNGIEADNDSKRHDLQPRSAPTLYNVTLLGSRSLERAQRAMTLRRGTGGVFRNVVIDGFSQESVDIRNAATAALARRGELSFDYTAMYRIGRDGATYFEPETGKADDDARFDEARHFQQPDRHTSFGIDPMLTDAAFDPVKPNFVPDAGSPLAAASAPIPQDEFFDQAASYLGAVRPGAILPWFQGWTAFPKD